MHMYVQYCIRLVHDFVTSAHVTNGQRVQFILMPIYGWQRTLPLMTAGVWVCINSTPCFQLQSCPLVLYVYIDRELFF